MNKKPNRRDLLRLIGASTATGSLQLYGTKTVQSVGGNITKRTIQIRNNLDKKQNFDISIVPASENGDDPIFEQTIRVPGNSKVTKNVNIQGGAYTVHCQTGSIAKELGTWTVPKAPANYSKLHVKYRKSKEIDINVVEI